jgi:hypothetical protein
MTAVPADGPRPASALPSVRARVLAFISIVVFGGCGALIGSSLVTLQCHGNCTTQTGLGAIAGGAVAAVGVGVMVVLALRAMGEWRQISERQLFGETDQPGEDAQDG